MNDSTDGDGIGGKSSANDPRQILDFIAPDKQVGNRQSHFVNNLTMQQGRLVELRFPFNEGSLRLIQQIADVVVALPLKRVTAYVPDEVECNALTIADITRKGIEYSPLRA